MSMESAQGRKGVLVELVGVFVGEIGCCVMEEVSSSIMIWVLLSGGGEMGLGMQAAILLAAVLAVEVITVSGIGRGRPPPEMETVGFTMLTGGWITGRNPVDGAVWNTVGILPPLVGAREMMGVVGMGNATLKRGRDSGMHVGKLAGGERLSGEALGGVSGA